MRGGRRHYTLEERVAQHEIAKLEAEKELLAMSHVAPGDLNFNYYTKKKQDAEARIVSCSEYIVSYRQQIKERDAKASLDKEIEKWKESLTGSKQSSTGRSNSSTASRSPRGLSSFCSTGFLRRCTPWSKGGSAMSKLFWWAVGLEILWYLPKFLAVALAYVSK